MSMLGLETLVSTKFYNFDQASIYIYVKAVALMPSVFNE